MVDVLNHGPDMPLPLNLDQLLIANLTLFQLEHTQVSAKVLFLENQLPMALLLEFWQPIYEVHKSE